MKKKVFTYLMLVTLVFSLVLVAGFTPASAKKEGEVDFYLTILHNNDGESQVIDAGAGVLEDFGDNEPDSGK